MIVWDKVSCDLKELLGKTVSSILCNKEGTDTIYEVHFNCTDETRYILYHDQDCCEWVYLEDICGSWDDLLNSPILQAEEVSQDGQKGSEDPAEDESGDVTQWTFYKLATLKGYVTLRWYGNSNGFYSTSVSFARENPKEI